MAAPFDPIYVTVVFGAFLAAGIIKGCVGMGLPPTAIALTSLVLPLPEALALVTIPTVLSNVWQGFWGGHLHALARRFWSLAALMMGGVLISAFGLRQLGSPLANGVLGLVLAAFAMLALLAWRPHLARRHESWANPLCGALSGLVGGVTGVAAVPFLPYMQSLELHRHELVQALGMLFVCFTAALVVALVDAGALTVRNAGASAAAMIPTMLGLWLGQRLRRYVSAEVFRTVFLVVMLGLGLNMARTLV
jgi:uncharacterized membrane protein YfcA